MSLRAVGGGGGGGSRPVVIDFDVYYGHVTVNCYEKQELGL